MYKYLILTSLFISSAAHAETSDITGSIPTLLVGLIAMLVLIYILAGIAKKTNFMQLKSAGMKVISVLPITNREKLVIVEVGKQHLVIGVTAHSINLIKELDEPIDIPNQDFKQTLSKMIQQNNKQNND